MKVRNGTPNGPVPKLATPICERLQSAVSDKVARVKGFVTKVGDAPQRTDSPLRFVDLFCGLGGFRVAAEEESKVKQQPVRCVFSSDFDADSQLMYHANFGEKPAGDITRIEASSVPEHDLLFAGFPCQAFSIIGQSKGFEDTRGTLFFDVARVLSLHRPRAFVLENVRGLTGHDRGRTLTVIMKTLRDLDYAVEFRVLNALHFGLPQKRERVVIVGIRKDLEHSFSWPRKSDQPPTPLEDILEDNSEVDERYFASPEIRTSRQAAVKGKRLPDGRSIWHENKSGNVSPLGFSCALRAGASYNYLLVDGVRRLTPREMLRLQGFPEDYKIVVSYQAMRKLAGNSVPIPMIQAVVGNLMDALASSPAGESAFGSEQVELELELELHA